MKLFGGGYLSRESCENCRFKGYSRVSTLTIGDFWGIEKVFPELADGMGTSLVIARTEVGRGLLERIKSHALVLESSREAADHPTLQTPAKDSILRKLLFRDYAQKGADGHCDIPLILKKYGG
jgi:hypothetical protein